MKEISQEVWTSHGIPLPLHVWEKPHTAENPLVFVEYLVFLFKCVYFAKKKHALMFCPIPFWVSR